MRIRNLHLLRYGHFTDSAISFPPDQPDIHIVLGRNEAGKSTAMAAIEDLLFGIPVNSPHNFLHEYSAMRVGATLDSEGQVLNIRRRKGNRDTLLTEQDVPVAAGNGMLAPLLAGADRRFYARMFSLDHERLRQGGREILEARDEVGQMLFSASAGILGLRDVLKAMEAEADGLWASRRASHRKYFKADDKLKAAECALRGHLVTATKWQEAKAAYEATTTAYQSIEQEIEVKSCQLRKLGRIRRVYRDVRRHSELDTILRSLGRDMGLPEDALARLEKAAQEDANAAARIATLAEQLEAARDERAAMTFDQAILTRAEDIRQFHERRIQIRGAKMDLPKRRAELDSAQTRLSGLASELEWSVGSTDELICRIPGRAELASARELLNRRGEQLATVQNARTALAEAEEKLSDLTAKINELVIPVETATPAAVLRVMRDMGDFESRVTIADRDFQDAQARIQQRLKSLRPSVDGEETLAASSVPPIESVRTHRDKGRDLEQRLQSCRERTRSADQDLMRHRKCYERIVSDEEVASLDDLLRLRQQRDFGWSIIRRRYVDGTVVQENELSSFTTGQNIPDAYEAAVRNADQSADGRFAKAEVAARLTVIANQIAEQENLLEALRVQEQALLAEQDTLATGWTAMWAFAPLDPDTMLEWLGTRQEIAVLSDGRAAAKQRLSTLREQESTAKEWILTELAAFKIDCGSLSAQPLPVVIEFADDVHRTQQNVAKMRHDLLEAQRKASTECDRRRDALEKTEQDWSDWTTQWAAALTLVGLSGTESAETAQVQINVIDEVREIACKINDLKHDRIEKIERDINSFKQGVNELVQMLAPQLVGVDAENAVLELERSLDESSRVRELATAKESEVASLQKSINECDQARGAAREVIRNLQEMAAVDNVDALCTAIEQSDRLRGLRIEHKKLTEMLAEDGDGLSIAELIDECAAVDLDQIAAREQTLSEELDGIRDGLMEAREARSTARREFESIGGDDRAAIDAANRQSALAELNEIAVQYVRLRSGTLVLKWAIDRFRRDKQAPLLKRAGELFAILTGGSFVTLQLQFGEHDIPHLAGTRPDGNTVSGSGMSTGTADQLYLSLRIAAVEDYLDRAPVLPFVADDLFINFDDDRAAAGFGVLSQLAQKTQVLFFTHHHHLVEIARRALGLSISTVMLSPLGAKVAA